MVRERERKRGDLKHLSVHQWIRSAIPDLQQLISPIGFLFIFETSATALCGTTGMEFMFLHIAPLLDLPLRCTWSWLYPCVAEVSFETRTVSRPQALDPPPTVQVWIGTRTASRQQALDPALDPPSTAPTAQISFEICTASRPQAFDPPPLRKFHLKLAQWPAPKLATPAHCASFICIAQDPGHAYIDAGCAFLTNGLKGNGSWPPQSGSTTGTGEARNTTTIITTSTETKLRRPNFIPARTALLTWNMLSTIHQTSHGSKEEVTSLAPTHNQQQTTFSRSSSLNCFKRNAHVCHWNWQRPTVSTRRSLNFKHKFMAPAPGNTTLKKRVV